MAAPVGFLDLGLARADDHIQILAHQPCNERRCGGGFIGRVTVRHDIDIGLNVGEHAADDMTLALHPFGADNRPGGAGGVNRRVAAVIVININGGTGQRGAEIGNSLPNRCGFVVAREDHGDAGNGCHAPRSNAKDGKFRLIYARRLRGGGFGRHRQPPGRNYLDLWFQHLSAHDAVSLGG